MTWRIYRVVFKIKRKDGTSYSISEEFHAHGDMEATRMAHNKCEQYKREYANPNITYYCYAC